MSRVRFLFSKRGLASFVPHVEVPPLLSRSARRAGLKPLLTEGFSPHPRISLGPALPVGVPSLAEPAEIWLEKWEEGMLESWSRCMPHGFGLLRAAEVEGPSLNRLCKTADYRVFFRNGFPGLLETGKVLEAHIQEKDLLLLVKKNGEALRSIIAQPDRVGPGFFVKAFQAAGIVAGWQELLILRTEVGTWEENRVKPLV